MPKKLPDPASYSPFTKLVGLRFTKEEQGESQAILEVTERVLNNYGTVHGGAISTLADVAMGAALYVSLDDDEICKTVEMKVSYLKPATSGTLVCDARVVGRTRKLGTVEAQITNNGELIAKTTGKFHIARVATENEDE